MTIRLLCDEHVEPGTTDEHLMLGIDLTRRTA